MKKKNQKSLSLNKSTISRFTAMKVLGGVAFEELHSTAQGCQGAATRTACSNACG
ncbi:MAG: hypothetical protein ACI9Y7_001788 [Dokdonia sp.]|jgi:hypothetical protein